MNAPSLESVLQNLDAVLREAITTPPAKNTLPLGRLTSVINGQLGPYLGAQAKAIEELQAEVKRLKPTSP